MAGITDQSAQAWAITRRQYGLITYEQLRSLGFGKHAVDHRVATGRLHRRYRGVYVVGRRELSRLGEWMAAVLACGPDAVISHVSAAALYGVIRDRPGAIHVCVPRRVRIDGIRVHRGRRAARRYKRIPVTTPTETMIDLATCLDDRLWEAAVNEADSLGLCTPDEVRAAAAAAAARRAGVARVRRVLDPLVFVLTESELERLFLRIARRAGLPKPITRRYLSGYRIDFYWPDIDLVVECDSLRYHRTASKQTKDVLRDQKHAIAGRERLRFTHWQVRHDPAYVEATLRRVADRLSRSRPRPRRSG